MLGLDPRFRVERVGTMVRIVTHEREYGAWVRIDGHREGVRATKFVGAVLTEEFVTILDVIALQAHHVDEVELLSLSLLRGETLGLAQRPRRFFYEPPPGWQPSHSGPVTSWYPWEFPAKFAVLVVPPAERITSPTAIESTLAMLGNGLEVTTSQRQESPLAGLPCTIVGVQGRRPGSDVDQFREIAILRDDTFAYSFRIDTTMGSELAQLHETLRAVGSSLQPLPSEAEARIGEAFRRSENPFEHWSI